MPIAMDLSEMVAVITGISDGGLGSGIARGFAVAGADIALLYRTAQTAAEHQAQELTTLGVSARAYQADLREDAEVDQVFAAVARDFGRLDVLVNNAGVQPVQPLETMSVEDWRSVVDANATSTFLCTKHAAIHMDSGGAIIHIASIEGHQMARGHAHYSASKAAILMHAKAAAVEYGPQRIRVNTVSPGLIERPGLRESWPEGVTRWEAVVPAGRVGRADDIAHACVFLASPLAAWITGADLVVDGGVSVTPTW